MVRAHPTVPLIKPNSPRAVFGICGGAQGFQRKSRALLPLQAQPIALIRHGKKPYFREDHLKGGLSYVTPDISALRKRRDSSSISLNRFNESPQEKEIPSN